MNQTENIPEVLFKAREGDNENLGGGCSIGGKWKDLTSNELFKGKKVVLFSLPGAYTPTCSSQQLPGYEEKYEDLKKYFVEIDCFCYKKQTLLAGEKSTYSITFYIDPKMINDSELRNLNSMAISYTFLDSNNG